MLLEVFIVNDRRVYVIKPIGVFIDVIALNFSSILFWLYTDITFTFAKCLIVANSLLVSILLVSIFGNGNDSKQIWGFTPIL